MLAPSNKCCRPVPLRVPVNHVIVEKLAWKYHGAESTCKDVEERNYSNLEESWLETGTGVDRVVANCCPEPLLLQLAPHGRWVAPPSRLLGATITLLHDQRRSQARRSMKVKEMG